MHHPYIKSMNNWSLIGWYTCRNVQLWSSLPFSHFLLSFSDVMLPQHNYQLKISLQFSSSSLACSWSLPLWNLIHSSFLIRPLYFYYLLYPPILFVPEKLVKSALHASYSCKIDWSCLIFFTWMPLGVLFACWTLSSRQLWSMKIHNRFPGSPIAQCTVWFKFISESVLELYLHVTQTVQSLPALPGLYCLQSSHRLCRARQRQTFLVCPFNLEHSRAGCEAVLLDPTGGFETDFKGTGKTSWESCSSFRIIICFPLTLLPKCCICCSDHLAFNCCIYCTFVWKMH